MSLLLNIEPGSLNLCCHGKAVSITYFDCVFVALSIQHADRMRRIYLLKSDKCHDFKGENY